MKSVIFTVIILILVACKQIPASKNIHIENLKYAGFYWHFNEEKNEREFYLYRYIDIKKNGYYTLMRRDSWIDKPMYYTGFVDDHILNLIETGFYKIKYKPDYTIDIDRLVIYDGLTYCFDYSFNEKDNEEIQFIPPYAPHQLNLISSILDSIISKANQTSADTLLLEAFKNKWCKISALTLPPLPLPPPPINKKQKRFNPSEYK